MAMDLEGLDLERLGALLELLNDQNVSEFSYEDEVFNLKVRIGAEVTVAPVAAVQAPVAAAAPAAAAPAAAPAQEAPAASGHEVCSPMVGTFYRASSPDQPPFVELGDRVRKGQPLCIIEAMKLMNEIEADADGVISAVLVENAQPVQFGQPLFRITPG